MVPAIVDLAGSEQVFTGGRQLALPVKAIWDCVAMSIVVERNLQISML